MATVRDLLDTLLPAAEPATPATLRTSLLDTSVGRTEIGWVRVLKARVPAFDALETGDVAIIPPSALLSVAPERADLEALGAELGRARPSVLVLLEAETPEELRAVDELTQAVVANGLAAVRVTGRDPVGLERSIIGFLVNRRAELESEAARIEGDIERLALQGAGLDELVGAIAGALGRPIVLEGRRGDRLAVHAPALPVDSSAVAAAYLRGRGTAALRVPLPAQPGLVDPADPDASPGSVGAGSLVLLGERPASELEELASGRLAGLLALQMAREAAVRQARESARRAETLPAAGPPWVSILARQAELAREVELAREGELAREVELPRDGDRGGDRPGRASESIRAELRVLAPARRMSLRGDSYSLEIRLVAAAPPDDPGGLVLAGRVARFLGRPVAVSRPFGLVAERSLAEAEARSTLEVVERLARPPAVARAVRLPAYRLLAALHNLPDGPTQARLLLQPVLSARPSGRGELLDTLRAMLGAGGAAGAAATLGIHRNTVAYRVRRIEQIADWDLTDPDLRVALAIALRILDAEVEASF